MSSIDLAELRQGAEFRRDNPNLTDWALPSVADVLALVAAVEAAQVFEAKLLASESWDVSPAATEWLHLHAALAPFAPRGTEETASEEGT